MIKLLLSLTLFTSLVWAQNFLQVAEQSRGEGRGPEASGAFFDKVDNLLWWIGDEVAVVARKKRRDKR